VADAAAAGISGVAEIPAWPADDSSKVARGWHHGPFGRNKILSSQHALAHTYLAGRSRRDTASHSLAVKTKGDLNLNLEPLASLLPGIVTLGAQLLGEGKWHETLGLTPT
jgi:hypothetical protein